VSNSSATPSAVGAATVSGAVCWCGNREFTTFSPAYLRCSACHTLVVRRMPSESALLVADDDHDFYGRGYYERHIVSEYGLPPLVERARRDLPERCLHWLRTLLRYKHPPATVLELGSAHGGFVSLLRSAGFDATGLEMSPSTVEFACRTFGVPMLVGPVQEQPIEPRSIDVIALFDVLEHLPDPPGTMRHCLTLLKPDGLLIVQMPDAPDGGTYDDLVAADAPFLQHMKEKEHLHLFTRDAARQLFAGVGCDFVEFEPAIFEHYDMCLVASRRPPARPSAEQLEASLTATASGRLVLALLDLDDQKHEITQRYVASEADREARLQVIEAQGRDLGMRRGQRADVLAVIDAASKTFAGRWFARDLLRRLAALLDEPDAPDVRK
jgi:SAM-dependent methyltransferase